MYSSNHVSLLANRSTPIYKYHLILPRLSIVPPSGVLSNNHTYNHNHTKHPASSIQNGTVSIFSRRNSPGDIAGPPPVVSSTPVATTAALLRATTTVTGAGGSTATPMSTPTLQMFIQQYPEVNDQSSEEQAQLYKVYLLHLSGATPDDLEKYQTNAFNFGVVAKMARPVRIV